MHAIVQCCQRIEILKKKKTLNRCVKQDEKNACESYVHISFKKKTNGRKVDDNDDDNIIRIF